MPYSFNTVDRACGVWRGFAASCGFYFRRPASLDRPYQYSEQFSMWCSGKFQWQQIFTFI